MKLLQAARDADVPVQSEAEDPVAKGTPHWVRPQLVAQVRYTEITDDGRLRHPAYLGSPRRQERGGSHGSKGSKGSRGSKGTFRSGSNSKVPSASEIDAIVEQLDFLEKARKNGKLTLPDGDTLEVTNLHKVFWPAIKKTKGDLIRYYAKISPFILPVIDNRPLVMKRLPNGVDGPSFYQHRAPEPVAAGRAHRDAAE